MQTFQYEGDVHALRKWAVNRGDGRETPPEPFKSWIEDLLMSQRELGEIGYWVGVITPESPTDGEWCQGYPHAHYKSVGWPKKSLTAITYLAKPDAGGQFGLGGLNKDDPYEFIDVEEGLTIVCDGATWHGARPVTSGTRIALITSGPPLEEDA